MTAPKLLYFAERHPSLDAAGFVARWRQHGRLGMSLPRWRNIARYLQCDAAALTGLPLPALPCDGVAVVEYRSEAHRLAHLADREGGAVTKADERETFARPVATFAQLTEPRHLAVAPEPTPWKLFVRLDRLPGLTAEAFRAAWEEQAAGLLASRLAAAGCGYLQNHARSAEGAPPTLCDCVDEIDAPDAGEALRLLGEALPRLSRLGSAALVATRPTQLHPAP